MIFAFKSSVKLQNSIKKYDFRKMCWNDNIFSTHMNVEQYFSVLLFFSMESRPFGYHEISNMHFLRDLKNHFTYHDKH